MPRRRTVLSLALASSTAALAAGCSVLPGRTADRRKVTVWLMKDSASDAFIKKFSDAFGKEHDDIELDIQIQEWVGIGEKVMNVLGANDGNSPDVIEVGNTQVAQYVDQGGLMELTLESARDLGMDDWVPGLAEPGRFNNRQYGIPWYAANRVVIYNKEIWADAGLKKTPRTRAEWLTMTQTLNSDNKQGIYLAGQDWYTFSGFVWDEGGELASDRSGGWEGTLHSAEAMRAMEFYAELQALGKGPKNADEEHPPQADEFAKGNIAQIVAVPGAARAIEKANPAIVDKLGYFAIPGKLASRRAAVFTGGSVLVVPDSTPDRRSALAVIKALAGEEWQTELARTMDYVPNKTTLARVVAGEPGVAAMAEGAARGRATPNSPDWANVEADNPIKEYMSAVLNGRDMETEARKASERITRALT
ncbi:extracellular solute-binding protein [Streptomyces sp. SID4919]|uniref:extracellular solute-binding protein n=1 Tax=unclassified Streptomyces TaxID=2593676 RepID=UPI00082386D5|nr:MULTISPECIES: extracellular solute-binding protein [unclassified Streptomyces]MYY13423.1 extracellular solute-binding protein [Streptomyces sp. SID4919]SCK61307.1 carbohydrate ABC transporter substrate-binding protein, CUT1 family (TC 3.A.1.1.-) [Streptomyces sp. AmelKG-E11A]